MSEMMSPTDWQPMKTCKQCNKPQPLDEYYRSRESTDGYKHQCKTCCRANTVNRKRRLQARAARENKPDPWTFQYASMPTNTATITMQIASIKRLWNSPIRRITR